MNFYLTKISHKWFFLHYIVHRGPDIYFMHWGKFKNKRKGERPFYSNCYNVIFLIFLFFFIKLCGRKCQKSIFSSNFFFCKFKISSFPLKQSYSHEIHIQYTLGSKIKYFDRIFQNINIWWFVMILANVSNCGQI